MTVNTDKMIEWFRNHEGKLTYSMYGSRTGADGTADCSGSMTQALVYAGASTPAYIYSTVTLGDYIAGNGGRRVFAGYPIGYSTYRGDIVLMSWGGSMAASGGAGGHVGCMCTDNMFISTDVTTGGAIGTAVSENEITGYLANAQPNYIEIWRFPVTVTAPIVNPKPKKKENKKMKFVQLTTGTADQDPTGNFFGVVYNKDSVLAITEDRKFSKVINTTVLDLEKKIFGEAEQTLMTATDFLQVIQDLKLLPA